MTIVLRGLDEIRNATGLDLGATDWMEIADDSPARFEASLRTRIPPVAPVALERLPEFLVLSLTNMFLPMLLEVTEVAAGINYGTGEVRFPAPALPGARLRAKGRIVEVVGVLGGVQTTTRVIVEAEGAAEPVCVVDAISRWLE